MKNNEIKIRQSSSSLSEFVKRPLASDEEVEAFEKYAKNEAKEKEIKDSLATIYQDDEGNRVDVKKIIIKPKRGWFFNLFAFMAVAFIFGAAAYGAYNYAYLKIISSGSPASLEFESKKEISAGEEFYYDLNYKNEDSVELNNIEIKVKYPDNFIFLESDPAAAKNNNIWEIESVDPHRSGTIRIKGKLAGTADSANIILADMLYTPQNFSSEFKKSASFETKINNIGIDFAFNSSSSALVNEENEITIKFKTKAENYINNFALNIDHPEEVEIIGEDKSKPDSRILNNFGKNENELKIKFKIKEKKQPAISIKLKFELPDRSDSPEKYYLFYEKELAYDVVKSDLNINLIINGSPFDQGVDFGQTLHYSIDYANKGDGDMKDIIIMAALESDFLDWQTFSCNHNGKASGNAISWSKQEIPELEKLPSGAEAVIDFSIKIKNQSEIDLSKNYIVKSRAQYSIEGKSFSTDSQSNIITNKINSDLNLTEQIKYFNDDNIAVGSGPIPPKAGQTTSLKIYWTINNNLHELNDLQIKTDLPSGVKWDGKNRSSVGLLDYDIQSNQVIWKIGRLPVAINKAYAEFNVSISPVESDRNKIMIIMPGAEANAIDQETNMKINKKLKAKTTKLEDDNMASGDGIVQ